MTTIERCGRTVEEAVEEALKEFNTTRDQVEVKVVDAGSKGILGIGAKPVRVKVSFEDSPELAAERFLSQILGHMGLDVQIDVSMKERQLYINLKGSNMGILIGKRGQTLDSLQYLVNLVINKGDAQYISVMLDTENYRKRRRETLENLAVNLAKKARLTRRPVVLEPMNPYERRIIHATLQNDKQVSTYSEGDEPFRNVVIVPK
ncbi:MAG: protein jag [Defluviitaleaceae bacterium]|nr:protein jag [Defluviitaleaceae bacterium]